jgi:ribosome-associated protein
MSSPSEITEGVHIPEGEIEFHAIRAQGKGGQNVNKVSSAIHLRFDIGASSLPDDIKSKLLACKDRRISKDGVIVIKAQRHRTRDMNRTEALRRLGLLVEKATQIRPARKATKPPRRSRQRRLDQKTQRGQLKSSRRKPEP